MNESCHTSCLLQEWLPLSCVWVELSHTYERVMSHIVFTTGVAAVDYTRSCRFRVHEWSCLTHVNDSCQLWIRHETRVNEWCYTHKWVMSHSALTVEDAAVYVCISHVSHLNESCHGSLNESSRESCHCVNESCHCVNESCHSLNKSFHSVSHLNESWQSVNESCHSVSHLNESCHEPCHSVSWMSRVILKVTSCHFNRDMSLEWVMSWAMSFRVTLGWVMSRTWMRHVTHIWMCHVTNMNESCLTRECITSHTYEWVSSRSWMSIVIQRAYSGGGCHTHVYESLMCMSHSCVWVTSII